EVSKKSDDTLVNDIQFAPLDIQKQDGEEPPVRLESIILSRSEPLQRAFQRGTLELSRTSGSSQSKIMVQQALIYLDYEISPDGDYGDNTVDAVRAFQRRLGISPDSGDVDAQTLRAIDEAVVSRKRVSNDSSIQSGTSMPVN